LKKNTNPCKKKKGGTKKEDQFPIKITPKNANTPIKATKESN
jgi:hypothetical protein